MIYQTKLTDLLSLNKLKNCELKSELTFFIDTPFSETPCISFKRF